MRITSFALFAAGVILLIFGLSASDSVSSDVSEVVTGAPSDKSIWLIVLGVIALLSGAGTLFAGRRR